MRVSAWRKSVCQGQRAGRCSVQRRAVLVRRPGIANSRRRRGGGGAWCAVGEAEHVGPSAKIVREARDDRPGAVGVVVPGWEVRERLSLEVADDELDDGVLAVLGIDLVESFGAIGDERVMAPECEQLGLFVLGVQVHATHDQAIVAERRLGHFADCAVGVVDDAKPGVISDLRDLGADDLVHRDADRVRTALRAQSRGDLLVPKSGVGAQQDRAACTGLADARDQLVDEAQRAALRIRAAVAHADVQDLVGVGACRDDRVISQLAGIAVAGTALVVAVNLADEAVDIDDQPPAAGADAELPRAAERLTQDTVKLAEHART